MFWFSQTAQTQSRASEPLHVDPVFDVHPEQLTIKILIVLAGKVPGKDVVSLEQASKMY